MDKNLSDKDDKKAVISVYMSSEICLKMEQTAREEGLSRSEFVAKMLDEIE